MNDDLVALTQDSSPEKINSFRAKYADSMKDADGVLSTLSEQDRQSGISMGSRAYASMMQNKPEVTTQYLESIIESYNNAGDTENANKIKSQLDFYKIQPEAARASLGITLSSLLGPEKFAETFKALKTTDSEIASTEAVTQVKIESAKKLKIENIQLAKSLKDMAGKDGFIIDPKEKFDAELKLTDNFKKHTKVFDDTDNAYRRIVNATDDQLGDLSLIIGYMKMLDPGSVVREGEAEMVRKTKDIPTAIWNWYETVVEKRRLLPEQREKIFKQSKSLWGTADLKAKGEKDRIERQAKKYGLSDIFTKETKMGNEKPEDGKIGSGDNKPTEAGSAFMLKYNLIK